MPRSECPSTQLIVVVPLNTKDPPFDGFPALSGLSDGLTGPAGPETDLREGWRRVHIFTATIQTSSPGSASGHYGVPTRRIRCSGDRGQVPRIGDVRGLSPLRDPALYNICVMENLYPEGG